MCEYDEELAVLEKYGVKIKREGLTETEHAEERVFSNLLIVFGFFFLIIGLSPLFFASAGTASAASLGVIFLGVGFGLKV